jgi:hypothetical protein
MIVPAENSYGMCDIEPCGGYRVHEASDHRLLSGQIAGFFVGLSLLKVHCHWCGNWSGLIHSELCQDHPNVAILMDGNCVMLPIAFDDHAEVEGDTPEIIHLEPLFHLILDLPNQAFLSNDKEIIDIQNDHGNNYVLIFIMEHEQSSIDM